MSRLNCLQIIQSNGRFNKSYIMRTSLFISIFFFLHLGIQAQNDFQWSKDLDLPYTDVNGSALTGTEIIHLVTHKGKIYAGNSYWNETTAPRRGQVWVKNTFDGKWLRDYQMPTKHSRVPSLYSFTFTRNYLGAAIAPDTVLFAGATYDKGAGMNGPAVVFMRNDATSTWISHNLGFTNHAFDYTQIRSMGFHRDKATGVDLVFAGANPAPTGVYAGAYNPASPGKIQWRSSPEFAPSGFQRIMGFAVCNDTLYMATQREVYKRIDGTNPTWVQVLNMAMPSIIGVYGAGLALIG
jgi:poly(A) polymerase